MVRTGTRTAGIGEHPIHHTAPTSVDVAPENYPGANNQAHLSKSSIPTRWDHEPRGGRHNRPRIPAGTRRGYHTPNIRLFFFAIRDETPILKAVPATGATDEDRNREVPGSQLPQDEGETPVTVHCYVGEPRGKIGFRYPTHQPPGFTPVRLEATPHGAHVKIF